MYKEIVILTKSKKNNKYCVAGIELNARKWIRLVTFDKLSDGALDDLDLELATGGCAESLDVVRVSIIKEVPVGCQTENNLIERRKKLYKIGKMSLRELFDLVNPIDSPYIFLNANRYLDNLDGLDYSLVLAKVTNMRVYYNDNGKRKADFQYNIETYAQISVTDPIYLDLFEETGTKNELFIDKAYVVVSIPHKPHNATGFYYKFLAKIFPVDAFFDEDEKFDFTKPHSIDEIIDTFEFPIPVKKSFWTSDFYHIIEDVTERGTTGVDYKGVSPYGRGRTFSLEDSDLYVCDDKVSLVYKHKKNETVNNDNIDFDFEKTYTINEIVERFEFPIPIKRDIWFNDFYYNIESIYSDFTKGTSYLCGEWESARRTFSINDSGFYVCKDKGRLRIKSTFQKNIKTKETVEQKNTETIENNLVLDYKKSYSLEFLLKHLSPPFAVKKGDWSRSRYFVVKGKLGSNAIGDVYFNTRKIQHDMFNLQLKFYLCADTVIKNSDGLVEEKKNVTETLVKNKPNKKREFSQSMIEKTGTASKPENMQKEEQTKYSEIELLQKELSLKPGESIVYVLSDTGWQEALFLGLQKVSGEYIAKVKKSDFETSYSYPSEVVTINDRGLKKSEREIEEEKLRKKQLKELNARIRTQNENRIKEEAERTIKFEEELKQGKSSYGSGTDINHVLRCDGICSNCKRCEDCLKG
ncbi:MAG: hypothetical protein IJX02_05695 [Clostridia bacterium]|nr:hypothetical protein [Clostridia bacterium]